LATIVGAFGVPHTPSFPVDARATNSLGGELNRLYGEVSRRLIASQPDIVIILSTDHFNTFFVNLPIFSIGVANTVYGPSDRPDMPSYKISLDQTFAHGLQHHAVKSGFDVGAIHEFALDHTFVVPYHFLINDAAIPIVPVFLSTLAGPTPTARRCFDLGSTLGAAIEGLDASARVAVVASGSFSFDLGGIHEDLGGTDGGVPDSDWADRVVALLNEGRTRELVEAATDEQLARAGNIGGELLNWIAMTGMFDQQRPTFLERQKPYGHAYGSWDLAQ